MTNRIKRQEKGTVLWEEMLFKVQKRKTSLETKRVKIYLLPSIRLPGRGLPLNMAAVHPKMILTHTRKRGEERHCYSSPQGKVGNGRRAAALPTEKPPPPHPIHPHSLRRTRTPLFTNRTTKCHTSVSGLVAQQHLHLPVLLQRL